MPFIMARLDPAIHAFERPGKGVDARIKSAQDGYPGDPQVYACSRGR
jgi:hypothetical protein